MEINFDLDLDRCFWLLDYKGILCFGFEKSLGHGFLVRQVFLSKRV
jgi:hypothetical protein